MSVPDRPAGGEDHFRVLAETLPVVFWVFDAVARRVLYVSSSYRTIWGRTPEDLYANPVDWQLPIHDEDRPAVAQAFWEAVEGGRPYESDYRIVRPDGSLRWIHDRGSPALDAAGRVERIAGFAEDVTERKRTEAALFESEARFRRLADDSPLMIWMSDVEQLRTYFNSAWLAFRGRKLEQELGSGWIDGVHPEDREACLRALGAGFTSQSRRELEFRLQRHDGEYRWISIIDAPRFLPSGEFQGRIGSCVDVSDRKRAAEQLRSMASELLLAEERERRRLAVDLHDGLVQIISLAQMKTSASARHAPEDLRAELKEIEALIGQANQSARTLTFELSPPILHDLGFEPAVQWLVENVQNSHGIAVELIETGPPVELDERIRVLLFRAVRELLVNVAKHAKASRARVRLDRKAGRLRIDVEDDGQAFDPASTGHRGIGLFSIRERLSQLGGSMTIESESGRGTKVRIVAPLVDDGPRGGAAGARR